MQHDSSSRRYYSTLPHYNSAAADEATSGLHVIGTINVHEIGYCLFTMFLIQQYSSTMVLNCLDHHSGLWKCSKNVLLWIRNDRISSSAAKRVYNVGLNILHISIGDEDVTVTDSISSAQLPIQYTTLILWLQEWHLPFLPGPKSGIRSPIRPFHLHARGCLLEVV